MNDIHSYIEAAKIGKNVPSDAKLAVVLGISQATIAQYRTGRSLPSDENMIKLAEFAGLSPERALLDLNMWRVKNTPALPVYQRLSVMLQTLSLCAIIYAGVNIDNSAHAVDFKHKAKYDNARVCILWNIQEVFIYILRLFFSPRKVCFNI